MPQSPPKWTLSALIDFESALSSWSGAVGSSIAGESSRSATFRQWLESNRSVELGQRWVTALHVAGALCAVVFLAIGASTAWGVVNATIGGIHVMWFLVLALFLPWIVLFVGLLAWLLGDRAVATSAGGRLLGLLSVKLGGKKLKAAMARLHASRELSTAFGWRIARISQWVAAAYHGGAILGLTAIVLFKRVGFYWETTTERAMAGLLGKSVEILSLPWAWFFPAGVPDVTASQRSVSWQGGGEDWWPFLLLALFVWGVLPRLSLSLWAMWREQRVLARLQFQAPHHRKLWRMLTEVKRGAKLSGPQDGALVISLDGVEPAKDQLRPFMLRALRMNPTRWAQLGVLDRNHEEAARSALKAAPAGVILLAEGWSLAPRSLARVLDELTAISKDRRMVLLVCNPSSGGGVETVSAEQRSEWERFIDSRADCTAELVFFEEVDR